MNATRTRGFTLIEMMVAVGVGALSIAIAVQIAGLVVKQSAKGRQRNDFSSRARLLGRQLRADLRLAGMGATGAIAVDQVSTPLGQISFPTNANFQAIPAVAGANGLNAGALPVAVGSDAIQMVVSNPKTLLRTSDRAYANNAFLPFAGGANIFTNCPMVYVSDHSAPSGAGRAQIAFVSNVQPTQVQIDGVLQFTAAPGSDVMCARISTYWVDNTNVLHRSDMRQGAAVTQLDNRFPVFVDAGAVNDVVSPGVLDLQIAYRVSSEVYHLRGQAGVIDPRTQWVYEGNANNPNAFMENFANFAYWFEVRAARMHILGRTLREVDSTAATQVRGYTRLEDAATLPPITVRRGFVAEWITTEEGITNLRYFDLGSPEMVRAEPY